MVYNLLTGKLSISRDKFYLTLYFSILSRRREFWLNLKVLSCQIRSTMYMRVALWHHRIGLGKDVNRYRFFFIFIFWPWIFEKSSKFWAAKYKNTSNLLIFRLTACIESCLPIGWRTIIWRKNSPRCCTILVWIAGCWNSSNMLLKSHKNPKNNCWLSRIFGDRFGRKHCGLTPYNPSAEEVGGLEVFLNEGTLNFELFSNIQDQNYKIINLYELVLSKEPHIFRSFTR